MYSVSSNVSENRTINNIISYAALITCIIIVFFVLFRKPNPGVADQGDFQRVMIVSGLSEIPNAPGADDHWFKYVTTKYDVDSISPLRLLGLIPTTSMIYPISLSRLICKLAGMNFFETRILAFVYSIIYIISLYICIKYLNLKNSFLKLFVTAFSIFVLFDGNYLVWFNSIYGEAMMSSALLLFIACVLYFIESNYPTNKKSLFFIFISMFFFLGSKMQCFSALPIMAIFFLRIYTFNRKQATIFHRKNNALFLLMILFFYVGGIYFQINNTCGIDTQYNSVFYGILKNSDDPQRDLKMLGLSSDMALEAGKHAYLSKDQYVKYTPGSELTKNEFNKKISNIKLFVFYLKQPASLIRGMEYTASKCFDTGSSLGKYESSSGMGYIYKLNRFTSWSTFRAAKIPKNLLFIIIYYSLFIFISITEYKTMDNKLSKLRVELLWTIILIGLLQFPMPYIGNGEADTAKQLFLFNYTFDISLIASAAYILNKIQVFAASRKSRIFS